MLLVDGGPTYYCFGMNDGSNLKGVGIGIANQLHPFVFEVNPVDKRIM